MIYAAGGNPYGTSVTADGEPLSDEIEAAIRHQAERLVEVTSRFVAGREGEDDDGGWRSTSKERAGSTA